MFVNNIKRKLTKFIKQSFKMKLLLISAFFISGIMRLLILFVPFKKIVLLMGEENRDSQDQISDPLASKALKVGWAVNTICNHTPWESKCYVRSLTAQFILKLLKIPSTIYFGVAWDETKNLIAHAWLRCGQYVLTGESGKDRFKCLSFYSTKLKYSPR